MGVTRPASATDAAVRYLPGERQALGGANPVFTPEASSRVWPLRQKAFPLKQAGLSAKRKRLGVEAKSLSWRPAGGFAIRVGVAPVTFGGLRERPGHLIARTFFLIDKPKRLSKRASMTLEKGSLAIRKGASA